MEVRNRKMRRGFTLIEVLLVLVILGMVATIGIVAYTNIQQGAKIDTTKSLIDAVTGALKTYNLQIGHYPTDDEGGLGALLTKPTFTNDTLGEKWHGPYLEKDPLDAWGNKLNYRLDEVDNGSGGKVQMPRVWSNGPDGQDGSDDDIRNWKDETTGK